jgi:hypothetical protein
MGIQDGRARPPDARGAMTFVMLHGAGATPYRMTSREPAEYWHDMICDDVLGDTMLDRLVYHSHRLIFTAGSSRCLGTLESPTDFPPSTASLPG